MHRLHDISEYMKERASDLGGRASDLGGQIQHGAGKARDWFEQSVDEYPLAVGAAFFTLGLASGFALPATRSENRWVGSARDRMLDKAQEVGSQLIERGEEAAQRAVGAVKQAVSQAQDNTESP